MTSKTSLIGHIYHQYEKIFVRSFEMHPSGLSPAVDIEFENHYIYIGPRQVQVKSSLQADARTYTFPLGAVYVETENLLGIDTSQATIDGS